MNDVMKEAFRKAGLEGKQPSDKSRAKETPPGNRSGYAGPPPASRSGSTRTAATGFILRDDYTRQAEQVIQQLRVLWEAGIRFYHQQNPEYPGAGQ